MDTYSAFRAFADSWMLAALFGVFLFAVYWAYRPGSRAVHDDAAQVPFRHEDRPASDTSDTSDPKEGQQ